MEAAIEIGLAVVATTLTICAVFIPVAFMSGIAGQFFAPFGFTVTVAVLFSLLVARTLTPMMAAYFLKPHDRPVKESKLLKWYLARARWCLTNRWKTSAVASVAIGAMLACFPLLRRRSRRPATTVSRSSPWSSRPEPRSTTRWPPPSKCVIGSRHCPKSRASTRRSARRAAATSVAVADRQVP